MNKVEVTNISTATVVLVSSDLRARREIQPGRTIIIPEELYEDLSFNSGFTNLINGHYIKVTGGENTEEIPQEKIFDVKKISEMLDKEDVTNFAKFIPTAADAEKDSVVELAVEKGITNGAITALIKKYCGVDVVKAIAMKHSLEEK